MPRGPNGEKRPADTIGAAVMVAKIATGEIEEDLPKNRPGQGKRRQGAGGVHDAGGAEGAGGQGGKGTVEQHRSSLREGVMGVQHTALAVADTLVRLARENEIPITPMQVQKLTYFSHAWNLGLGYGPLFQDAVESWQYGPVIRSVYQRPQVLW